LNLATEPAPGGAAELGDDPCSSSLPATNAYTTNYCYDEFDRLRRQRSPGAGEEQAFFYDGLDRRDQRNDHVGGTTETSGYSYIGATSKIARQQMPTAAGSSDISFDYDSNNTALAVTQKSSGSSTIETRTFATDANGNPTGLEDTTGVVAQADRYVYDPYGDLDPNVNAPAPGSTADTNPLRFNGFDYDTAVKTYDMRARDYRPDIGRFLQADRYESAGSDLSLIADPLTQNRYDFVGNDPVDSVEWDGHDKQDSWHEFEGGRADESGQGGNCHTCRNDLKKRPKDKSTKDYVIEQGGTYTTTGGSECSKQGCHPAPAKRSPNPKIEYWNQGIPAPPKPADDAARAAGLRCLDASMGGGGCAVWQTDTPAERDAALLQLSVLIPIPAVKGLQIGRSVFRGGRLLFGGRKAEAGLGLAAKATTGARDAAVTSTAQGERFVRVGAKPENLNMTFEHAGGTRAGTYAFPEKTYNAIGHDPALLKDFGDLPGSLPNYSRLLEPPAGTPIQRGIVPGGEFGGRGGVPEVFFPEGF
jgi:RHS repeat-associated protein